MKLFVRGLFACSVLMAGTVFTGCSSPSPDQLFSDHPRPAATGRPSAAPPPDADVARFRVGETVDVSFSGSPIPIDPHQEPIKEDGNITLPLIGAIHAVGKTAGELQSEIYTNYVPKYYVRLTVTVKSSADRVIYVGGEVHGAGRVMYLGDTTVTKAIQSASGLTDFANHTKVWLTRSSNHQRIRVNYDEALKNPAKDPPVYPDDQLYVDKKLW